MYHILPYSYNKARQLGVQIYPSKKKIRKLMFIKIMNIYL